MLQSRVALNQYIYVCMYTLYTNVFCKGVFFPWIDICCLSFSEEQEAVDKLFQDTVGRAFSIQTLPFISQDDTLYIQIIIKRKEDYLSYQCALIICKTGFSTTKICIFTSQGENSVYQKFPGKIFSLYFSGNVQTYRDPTFDHLEGDNVAFF